MFNRVNKTYDFDPEVIAHILHDDANPLNRISQIIPENVKVLDIGAGNGLLACLLMEKRNNIIIDGIEPDPYAAKIAGKYYRHFYCGIAQEFKDMILRENYDFIILADVIEHINDPLALLRDLCSGISKKTRLIISVPNIAFGAVRMALLNGEFQYVDSGILEKTHVRFFTLKTLKTLISELNMNIEKLYFLQRDLFNTEIDLNKFKISLICLLKILSDDLSSTYQFLMVLTKENVSTEKRCFGEKARHSVIKYLLKKVFPRRGAKK